MNIVAKIKNGCYETKAKFPKERMKENCWKREMFKKDVFENFGVTDNPKAERCFEIAWEDCHSYGFNEVFNKFGELIDLII